MVPVLFLVVTMVFVLIRIVPGDVAVLMVAEAGGLGGAAGQTIEKIRSDLHLNEPIYVQYLLFLRDMSHGDLGRSYYDNKPALGKILDRLPVTLELAILSIAVSLMIAVPLGVISAIRQDSWIDYIARLGSILALSMPLFWTGTMLVIFPAIWFNWLPPLGYAAPWEDLSKNLKQFLVPALVLGAALAGTVARMTRSAMLEVLRQDYIRTALAKGLRERVIIYRHALKNAMIPVITIVGLQVAFLLGGSVVVETIFSLPGVGRLTVNSVFQRDLPQLQVNVLFFSFIILMVNLMVDLTYGWLDPRIRYR